MFKVNNKDIRKTSWRYSGVFIVNFEYISYLFYNFSLVYFEQVNASSVLQTQHECAGCCAEWVQR